MHFKSILHVRDHSKATGTSHHLLQTIANHVNRHTGEAFGPSVDRLAVRLDVTPQWIRQLRARLVAEGELIFKQSRGRHPNVYIIPWERCPACQGSQGNAPVSGDPLPDDFNPQVGLPDEINPKVAASQPTSKPETLTAPTRNSAGANPKVGEPFEVVRKRIELQKDLLKEEREKKESATRNCLEPWLEDKPERQSPFWCAAHGFCHSERMPDHLPGCWLKDTGVAHRNIPEAG
jgi:hypothetical protein